VEIELILPAKSEFVTTTRNKSAKWEEYVAAKQKRPGTGASGRFSYG